MTLPFPHILQETAAVLTSVFLAGLWQGTALMLLAAALLRLLPRASASVRHSVLVVGFLAAFVLPWLHFSAASASGTPMRGHAIALAPAAALVIAGVWLVAAAGRVLQLGGAWLHLRRIRAQAQPVVLQGVSALEAGSRSATLYRSDEVDSPTVLGFLRPVLLLPSWMVPALLPDELNKIAAHECAHLRRRDDWLNLALQLAIAASPLNPALLWMNRRIGAQRELACDAEAVSRTGEPVAYASCLARLAEQRLQRRGHLRLALAAWERRSELAQRVHALLREPSAWSAKQSAAAMAGAAAVLLAASAGMMRVPQFVRVASPVETTQAAALTSTSAPVPPSASPLARSTGRRVLTDVGSEAPGMPRMVPVSFQLPEVHRTAPKIRRGSNRHRTAHLQADLHAAQHVPGAVFPRRSMAPRSATAFTRVVDDADVPVRLVPATFSDPYVAVPLSGGWLLIQL